MEIKKCLKEVTNEVEVCYSSIEEVFEESQVEIKYTPIQE